MKNILFIDSDESIRDDVRDYIERNGDAAQIQNLRVQILASFADAEKIFDGEKVDGIIIDAIRPSSNNILPFIQKTRIKKSDLPIIALVGFIDMIVDEKLKRDLKNEQVQIVDKLEALANITNLLQNCCGKNNGGDS